MKYLGETEIQSQGMPLLDLADIQSLIQRFFGEYNTWTMQYADAIDAGSRGYIYTFKGVLSGNHSAMVGILINLGGPNLESRGGLVVNAVFNELRKVQDGVLKMNDRLESEWGKPLTPLLKAFDYWKEKTMGSIYVLARGYLIQIKNSEKIIKEGREWLKKLDTIKDSLNPRGIQLYNSAKEDIEKAEAMLAEIKKYINLDEAYKQAGLGWAFTIPLAIAIVIISLGILAILLTPLAETIFGQYTEQMKIDYNKTLAILKAEKERKEAAKEIYEEGSALVKEKYNLSDEQIMALTPEEFKKYTSVLEEGKPSNIKGLRGLDPNDPTDTLENRKKQLREAELLWKQKLLDEWKGKDDKIDEDTRERLENSPKPFDWSTIAKYAAWGTGMVAVIVVAPKLIGLIPKKQPVIYQTSEHKVEP